MSALLVHIIQVRVLIILTVICEISGHYYNNRTKTDKICDVCYMWKPHAVRCSDTRRQYRRHYTRPGDEAATWLHIIPVSTRDDWESRSRSCSEFLLMGRYYCDVKQGPTDSQDKDVNIYSAHIGVGKNTKISGKKTNIHIIITI